MSNLFAYVDDSFSWELEGNLLHYAPYDKLLPAKQASQEDGDDKQDKAYEAPQMVPAFSRRPKAWTRVRKRTKKNWEWLTWRNLDRENEKWADFDEGQGGHGPGNKGGEYSESSGEEELELEATYGGGYSS